ncbi:MAG: UvrABC system protein C [Alphaproteobacteria bacterium MarineAlpha9_Bin7]|nr:MAG: UvrABC system protein C [Alphaproteobacteria bacterium MarineAlpha9_Bin7]
MGLIFDIVNIARSERKGHPEVVVAGGQEQDIVGVEVIRRNVGTLPSQPGVYRMLDARGKALYVGKARNLKRRVSSYARGASHGGRIAQMVCQISTLEIITTHTEAEALLLEANLIKKLKPRYNVVLRDDKSHPYILLSGDHAWPKLVKHRGARSRKGEYFGPFASAGAVNRTLNALQRAFPLRTCSDSVFSNRSRPCLQYQIKRCTAPCVDYISREEYAYLVGETRDFLSGKSAKVANGLAARMQEAGEQLEFETASILRDRIRALAHIQSHQGINVRSVDDADVIAVDQQAGQTCIQVFFFRGGSNYGNRAHFPTHHRENSVAEVLGPFVGQFYEGRNAPKSVLLSHDIEHVKLVEEALNIQSSHRVRLLVPRRGEKRRLVQHALTNARHALDRRLSESASQRRLLEGLAETLELDFPPNRIEVYDNSHTSGSQAVGAMIVAGLGGLTKNAYRKFNIRVDSKPGSGAEIKPGDDYGMMRQVLTRRFARLQKEDPDRTDKQWPDLVLVDGGAGQLSVAGEEFADLGVRDVALAAVAKGPERAAGRERIYLPGRAPIMLPPSDPVLYFLQRLRDEAHRFAIGTHRTRRSRDLRRSELDEILGVGSKRKRALLHRFGSVRAVADAGLQDLQEVVGINHKVAQLIYNHFHSND